MIKDNGLNPLHWILPKKHFRAECVLIPVEHPVNGSSIVPAKMDESEVIEYFHIELETHAIIFAEGVPAETLLVNTGRVKDCMETMSGRR
jgi:hypothetical protein